MNDEELAEIVEAVEAGIQLANARLDWDALEGEVGGLRGYNLAIQILDAGDAVGFRLDGRQLVKLRPEDLRAGGVVTHRVTLSATTFWRVLQRQTTIDHAYYTAGAVNAWDVRTGQPDHRAASVLKRVFDRFMELVP